MIHSLKKYRLLYFFVYLTIWLSLSSTPLNEPFRFSVRTNQIFTLLIYLPFGLMVLWKLACDVRGLKKDLSNLMYYVLGFYYVILSAYRMMNGIQIKETLYYSVVLFGSVALYLQIRDGRWQMSRGELAANFRAILAYMIVYKIIFTLLCVDIFGFSRWLGNPPINNLYSTSMLVMLIPFLVDSIRESENRKAVVNDVLLCLSLILTAICESRVIFCLGFALYIALMLINVRSGRVVKRMLTAGVCAVLIVAILAAGNIAEVRNALNRATNLFQGSTEQIVNTQPADQTGAESDETDASTPPVTKPNPTQQQIQSQINRSDHMRADLMKLALTEVKKNPWFGTGDLYYTYDMGYKSMEQTAHNFILESLVSYGLVGTAMIAVLLFSLLISSGFFAWKKRPAWQPRAGAFAVLAYYFAMGMVQPSVYNALLCPLFTVLIAYYHNVFDTAGKK